jgi:hypothetical protein
MSELIPEDAAPDLYEFVERSKTELPGDYVPEAPGVIFPGEPVLSAAGYVAGANRPRGWRRPHPGNYRKYVGLHTLMVRQSGGSTSTHWTVERIDEFNFNTEALVFSLGSAPIYAHSYQAAMRLAEHCYRCYPTVDLPIPVCWMVARRRR